MGSSVNIGERSLSQYRDYLLVLARLNLGSRLRAKFDPSDIVQQTILRAHSSRSQFRGANEGEWLGWLRTILANTLAAVSREFETAARDLGRERSLENDLEQSSARMENLLIAESSSPSECAARSEELMRLARALCQLPDDQRIVVELHHLKGLPIAQVAAELGRTRPAVVGLLYRGLQKLRGLFAESPEGEP